MIIARNSFIGKIRTAIDDIATAATDSFSDNVNDELWQATLHAATELSLELPIDLLEPSTENLSGTVSANFGSVTAELPSNYLRFVSLDITDCAGIVRTLMEGNSDAELMQRSVWGRGTATKPKVILENIGDSLKRLSWWPGGEAHNTALLQYIAYPELGTVPSDPNITCAIRQETQQFLIYRAASIFFEGKKEDVIADKFRTLSTNY
jgi:hypothetical protein